jgi:sugar phosphate isomerase/epimerase
MRLGLEAGKDTLDLAAKHGVRGVPISAAQLVKDGVDGTLAPLAERGLVICQIGAFGFNALRMDAEQRRILAEAIPLASQTGCPYIVIGPGNYQAAAFAAADPNNFTDAALDEMAEALAPLLTLAEAHGVYLSIEAYLKGAISSPDRFLALQQRTGSPALKANIDVSSLYDFRDLVDPSRLVESVCTGLVGHYGLVHLKEVALSEGFHLHAGLVPLGQGPTDWAQVLRLVAPHLPADSWVVLEHVQTAEEAATSLSLVQEAAARAGVDLV